jgi:hypothetical protein
MAVGQQAVLRLMELTAETLRSIAAAGVSAADAEHTFKRNFERLRKDPALGAIPSGLDLWTAAATQLQQSAAPWTDLMQRWIGIAAAMGGPSGAGDPLGDALERSFGVLARFPGVDKELPTLVTAAAANAVSLATARESYRVIMAATWQRAFEEICREMLRRAADGKPVNSPGTLLSLSTSVADRVFVETFKSAAYIKAQQRLTTALADQRRNEAQVVDLFARLGHFPTRREHDDVLREVSVLRREVRALKRLVRARSDERSEASNTAASRNGKAAEAPAATTPTTKRRARAKAAGSSATDEVQKKGDRGQ